MKKYTLPKEFGEKWIADLRSGEYEQTTGILSKYKNTKSNECTYCCLGVAAITNGIKVEDLHHGDLGDIFEVIPENSTLRILADNRDLQNDVMVMNDKDGKSFSEIADWIEENVELT